MERMEALTNYYTTHNEDARLTSKHGMIEFLTTIHYVEKYLKPGMRILEIGAGTGRYSHYFAQNGYDVDGFVHAGTKKFDHLPFTSGYLEWIGD